MKPSWLLTVAISLMALIAVSCGDAKKDEPIITDISAIDLAGKRFISLSPKLLPGYTEEEVTTVLNFVSKKKVYWKWSFLDKSGAWGNGSYKVIDNVLTIYFPYIDVIHNYEYGTFGGLVDGQSYLERYTIESYDGENLILIDSDGRREHFIAAERTNIQPA